MPENPSPPTPTPPSPVPPPEPLPPNPSPAPLVGKLARVRPAGDTTYVTSASRFPQGTGYSFGNKKRSAGSTLAAQAASL